jgi:hypothetical protein
VQLPERKGEKECMLTVKLRIEDEDKSSKIHCVMGCDCGPSSAKELVGKMIVYVKVQTEELNQEHYKYLGSGDVSLISMKLKPGEYMIVLELPEGRIGQRGQLTMGCSSGTIALKVEGAWRKKEELLI